jgi:hypothetical protein
MEDKRQYYKKYKATINKKYDNNKDGLISINEYLAIEKSMGPKEKEGNIDYYYQDEDNVYNFFTILQLQKIKKFKVLCIPTFEIIFGNKNDMITRTTAIIDVKKKRHFFPEIIKEEVKKCKKKDNVRIIYFTLKLILDSKCNFSHANMIVIDLFNKTIERFEPHGCCPSYTRKEEKYINDFFKNKGKKLIGLDNYKYISPKNISKKIGIQHLGDSYNGMCVTISMMYLHMRLLNLDTKPRYIIEHFIKKSKKEVKDTILRYAKYIEKTLKKESKLVKKLNKSLDNIIYGKN